MTAAACAFLPFVAPAISTPFMSEAAPTDETLVRETLAGQEQSFALLVIRHKSRVLGTCARFARDGQQLDDLGQEVFLRAWRTMRSFRGDAPFEHWLARITVTTCYDFLRRERRHREQVSLDDMVVEMRDHSVDSHADARGARELLAWAMRQISAEDQLILTLLEIEERSVRDIASTTGWSESNVKVRAFRARARLKEILTRSHES